LEYWDLLVITDTICNGIKLYQAKIAPAECGAFQSVCDDMLNKTSNSLNFVAEFDLKRCRSLHSGHLEQLAFACPNLQRLNVESNSKCLSSLQGLQTISQNCAKLCGLNLMCISVDLVEDQLKLWEILSSMRLTHLAIEACIFQPLIGNEENLVRLFKKCTSLYGLHLDASYSTSLFCEKCNRINGDGSLWSLSHFPGLKYCNLVIHISVIQEIINDCKELVCLTYISYRQLSLSSAHYSNLRQLCLDSIKTHLPNIFMESVSFHGGLIHVVVSVNSVMVEGITCLVVNSPGLLKMIIFTKQCICNEYGSKVNPEDFGILPRRFPGRKLFTAGHFRVVQDYQCIPPNLVDILHGTDLGSLW